MNGIDEYLKAVGANIRFERKRAKLSHADLGEMIGTSKGNVLRLEKGEHGINIRSALKIAAALEIEPKKILMANVHVSAKDLREPQKRR